MHVAHSPVVVPRAIVTAAASVATAAAAAIAPAASPVSIATTAVPISSSVTAAAAAAAATVSCQRVEGVGSQVFGFGITSEAPWPPQHPACHHCMRRDPRAFLALR